MENFFLEGEWWFPDNPDTRFYGRMEFDPSEKAELTISGNIPISVIKLIEKMDSTPIILGDSTNGAKVTLHNCRIAGIQFGGTTSARFWAESVFIGYHFSEEASIKFDTVIVQFTHFEDWLGRTGFRETVNTDPKARDNRYSISFSFPEEVTTQLNDYKLTIYYSFHVDGNIVKEKRLSQQANLKIEGNPFLFSHLQDNLLKHFQNLMVLAIGKPVYPVSIKGRRKDIFFTWPNGKQKAIDIDIFTSTRGYAAPEKSIHPADMLFCFSDIRDCFSLVLSSWIDKYPLYEPILDIYMGNYYAPFQYLEHTFLNMAHCLESFHRRRFKGSYMGIEDYKQIYDGMLKSLPTTIDSGLRESLKSRLRYLHEFSFRKRLAELLSKHKQEFSILMDFNEDVISAIVDTRNYYTHLDDSLKPSILDTTGLYNATLKLTLLQDFYFLEEIGIPLAKIPNLISRCSKYRGLIGKEKNES